MRSGDECCASPPCSRSPLDAAATTVSRARCSHPQLDLATVDAASNLQQVLISLAMWTICAPIIARVRSSSGGTPARFRIATPVRRGASGLRELVRRAAPESFGSLASALTQVGRLLEKRLARSRELSVTDGGVWPALATAAASTRTSVFSTSPGCSTCDGALLMACTFLSRREARHPLRPGWRHCGLGRLYRRFSVSGAGQPTGRGRPISRRFSIREPAPERAVAISPKTLGPIHFWQT